MLNRIRYRVLMRRLRAEIADVVGAEPKAFPKPRAEKVKTPVVTACKACGNIV